MTQPRRNIGPPSVGGQADHAGSQPATGANFRKLQRHARGVAEWIDAAQTAGAPALADAHDHRGGTYGRPLGSTTTVQFYKEAVLGTTFGAYMSGLFMIPDCSSPGGVALRNPTDNGGFISPSVWIYADSAGPVAMDISLSVRQVGNEQNRVFAGLVFNHPGGGKAWVPATEKIVLPSGFVSIEARQTGYTALADVQQFCLEIPH